MKSQPLLARAVSAQEMKLIDKKATAGYGIPALILMENAAIASAYWAMRMVKSQGSNIFLFCGAGNNGGDGFACARHLLNRGFRVKVYFAGTKKKMSSEAKINYQILTKLGLKIHKLPSGSLKRELKKADLVIDALLGIGVRGRLRPPYDSLIQVLNDCARPILALDVPSGLDATTGRAWERAIYAKRTVTFGRLKRGFLNPRAKKYVGRVTVADISLPRNI